MPIFLSPEAIHGILTTEAEKQQLPEHYKNDLIVHDLNWLHEYGSQEFVWVLRTCGTFMYPLDCMAELKGHYHMRHNWPDNLLSREHASDARTLYYYFSNAELKPVTYAEAYQLGKDAVSKYLRNEQRKREASALLKSME